MYRSPADKDMGWKWGCQNYTVKQNLDLLKQDRPTTLVRVILLKSSGLSCLPAPEKNQASVPSGARQLQPGAVCFLNGGLSKPPERLSAAEALPVKRSFV